MSGGDGAVAPTPATTGWKGFAWQAALVTFAMAVGVALAFAGAIALVEKAGATWLAVPVFFFALLFGLVPSVLSAASMRSWRHARPTSPYAIAALFSAAMLLSWGASSVLEPVPAGDAGTATVALGLVHPVAAALFAASAAIATRRAAPAVLGGVASLLASLSGLAIELFLQDAGRVAARLLVAAILSFASFAGALAYSLSEPRPRVAALVPEGFP